MEEDYLKNLSPYKLAARGKSIPSNPSLKRVINLGSNENPHALPELNITKKIDDSVLSRYPSQLDLIGELAQFYCVDEQQLVIGNGSNDILDLIARAFLSPTKVSVFDEYAFSIYQLVSSITMADVIKITSENYRHNLSQFLNSMPSEKAGVVWIANPNNPTGTFIDRNVMRDFLAKVPKKIIVVIDEAYYEYVSDAAVLNLDEILLLHENSIVVRTFSKAYGLAGQRIGYAITTKRIAGLLNKIRQPFNANSFGLALASRMLDEQGYVKETTQKTISERKKMEQYYSSKKIHFIPSTANFLAVEFSDADLAYTRLLENGIVTRQLREYGMNDFVRITIGTEEENTVLRDTLDTIL